jgi:bud site selection protein 20
MPAVRGSKSKKKTRRHTRDIDEIHADLHAPGHLDRFKGTKLVEDLPGLGEWYCTECAKWFESETNFNSHKKGSNHKRR